MPARNFICELSGSACTDGRCKRGQCIIEAEQSKERIAKDRAIADAIEDYVINNLPDESLRLARMVLKAKGKKQTFNNIGAVAALPQVREKAREILLSNARFLFHR